MWRKSKLQWPNISLILQLLSPNKADFAMQTESGEKFHWRSESVITYLLSGLLGIEKQLTGLDHPKCNRNAWLSLFMGKLKWLTCRSNRKFYSQKRKIRFPIFAILLLFKKSPIEPMANFAQTLLLIFILLFCFFALREVGICVRWKILTKELNFSVRKF